MMGENKAGDVGLKHTMSGDFSHHEYENSRSNNRSDMFMNSAGSFSCVLGLYGNVSNSAFIGSCHDTMDMHQRMSTPAYLGSGYVNKANENNTFNGFAELGLAGNLQRMNIGDEIKDLSSQEGSGFGFDGNIVNGRGQSIQDTGYDYGGFQIANNGISSVGDSMGLYSNNGFTDAMYSDASFTYKEYVNYPCEVRRQPMRGFWGEDVEMQNPIIAPALRDECYSLEYFLTVGAVDSGVRDTLERLNSADYHALLNANLSRGSSSVGNRPLSSMKHKVGVEAFGCGDDSIQEKGVKCVSDQKKGQDKNCEKNNRLNKFCQERPAFCSQVHQCEETTESGASQIICQGEINCQYHMGWKRLGSVLMDAAHSLLANEHNNIYLMAKDQLGCRLLQRMLDEGMYQDMHLIFKDTICHVSDLSVDPYGNYLVQKLLDVCGGEQITHIVCMVTKIPGELIMISKNIYGTRVAQKIIASAKTRQQISLVLKALEPGFLDLVKDLNGTHVLQQCLQCFCEEQNQFIFRGATRWCVEVATHRYGCCVFNQCIAHSSRRYRVKLIAEICANALLLAQDPFGNYVVQYIIDLEAPSAAVSLLSAFEGHFVFLSMQKFGSHVVEKCLKHYKESRPKIVHELLSAPRLDQLLQHPFANYVIQSALQVTKGPIRTLLVQAIRPHKILRTNPYCKKIFSTKTLK